MAAVRTVLQRGPWLHDGKLRRLCRAGDHGARCMGESGNRALGQTYGATMNIKKLMTRLEQSAAAATRRASDAAAGNADNDFLSSLSIDEQRGLLAYMRATNKAAISQPAIETWLIAYRDHLSTLKGTTRCKPTL